MTLIVIGVTVFGADITGGASQVALLLAALTVIGISLFHLKMPWSRLEEGIIDNLGKTGPAIFILLMIGALTSTWMLSGVVPTLIYYGMKLISPKIFLLVVFLLTAIVSVLSGSSWTTIGTIGVAMMSAGTMLGISEGWLAGAIISGAYFGDKRSPMSDTTNLASSVAGVDIYRNINYLLYTNMPSFIISGIVFTIVGFTYNPASELDLSAQYASLSSAFVISPWLLLIPCLTIFMIYKKIPPFITLFVSALLSGIIAFFVQPDLIAQICGDGRGFREFFYFLYQSLAAEVTVSTGDPMLDTLACTSGMYGMLGTIWLILCVIVFGGVMEASGMIEAVTASIISGSSFREGSRIAPSGRSSCRRESMSPMNTSGSIPSSLMEALAFSIRCRQGRTFSSIFSYSSFRVRTAVPAPYFSFMVFSINLRSFFLASKLPLS